MQRFLLVLTCCFFIATVETSAQGRKQIANFSQYQQYFNPSFTGFEGMVLKSLYRNQWTGFEDAPKTILASAEPDLQNLGTNNKGYRFNSQSKNEYLDEVSLKHALGVTVLYDRFGPSNESQLFLSYGSGVRLAEKLTLRWGTAVTYSAQRLDGSSLTVDQENDPKYAHLLGQNNRMGKIDLNLGLALSSEKFYMGYAMQDITKGKLLATGDDFMRYFYTQKHIVQAGFRTYVTNQFGLTFNSIYQHDNIDAATIEGQLKAVYQNMFWVGGGYRSDQAYSFTGGIRLQQLSVYYAYEAPVHDAKYISKPTNEIGLSYTLRKQTSTARQSKKHIIW